MFTRNNCQSNETGGTYIYIVPNGKYFSTISQEDANQKLKMTLIKMAKMQLIKMHHVELMDFIM